MPKANMESFYAVARGRIPGIYMSWADCEEQVKGFVGARYKKFHSVDEAQEWKAQEDGSSTSPAKAKPAARPYPDPKDRKGKGKDVDDTGDRDVVYCDGASKGNGKAGAVAGVGVWWGHGDKRNIAERCPGVQTNNRAELIGIIRVLETTKPSSRPLLIKTDSQYSINCIQQWLTKWRTQGFKTSGGAPVKNLPLVKYIDALLDERKVLGQKVDIEYVKGHAGIEGNEGADREANVGATRPAIDEEPDWESLEQQVRSRMADVSNDVTLLPPVASTSHEPQAVVPEPIQHSTAAVPAEPARIESSTTAAVKPMSTRQQRILAAIEGSLKQQPPASDIPTTENGESSAHPKEAPSAPAPLAPTSRDAPITPTKATTSVAQRSPSRPDYTPTRPPRTPGAIMATAAARAAYTEPSRLSTQPPPQPQADSSTVIASVPTRLKRGRPEEPTYNSVGVQAKLCDCCREESHRGQRSRSRSASPPPRRVKTMSLGPRTSTATVAAVSGPTTRAVRRLSGGAAKKAPAPKTNTQESATTQPATPSVTESDLKAFADAWLPADQLEEDLSF